VRLLRALQEREVTRVGGRRPIPVDVRLVAATHQELETLIGDGRFREDLYYRLKGVEIELPPLRDRKQDIPHLVRAFLEEFCGREGIPVPALRSEALALLLAYDFPGNVRELQNLIEGAVSLAERDIDAGLIRSLLGTPSQQSPEPLDLVSLEKRHISRVLKLTGGNKSEAAKILGLDRKTLQRKGF
jgi:DNA-binding NtrC family response regulator